MTNIYVYIRHIKFFIVYMHYVTQRLNTFLFNKKSYLTSTSLNTIIIALTSKKTLALVRRSSHRIQRVFLRQRWWDLSMVFRRHRCVTHASFP